MRVRRFRIAGVSGELTEYYDKAGWYSDDGEHRIDVPIEMGAAILIHSIREMRDEIRKGE